MPSGEKHARILDNLYQNRYNENIVRGGVYQRLPSAEEGKLCPIWFWLPGGMRSGKSRYAEERLRESRQVLYIATARCLDKEMERRIAHHRASRPAQWVTAEACRDLDEVLRQHPEGDVLLDCVTNMVTNLMLDEEADYDALTMDRIEQIETGIREQMARLVEQARRQDRTVVLVSGEVGMSLVPVYRMGRVFTDILGRVNQYLAEQSDEVIFMVSGLPLQVK